MANGNGNDIRVEALLSAVSNPKFQNLSVAEQQSVLAYFDPRFAQLSTNDLPGVVNKLQRQAMARPYIVPPPTYLAAPAGAGTPQEVPNYTARALNPAGGFAPQGQFTADLTPEQRSQLAVVGGVGLGAGALGAGGIAAWPYAVAAAQTPLGQRAIDAAVKGASGALAAYPAYRVARAIKNVIFGDSEK